MTNAIELRNITFGYNKNDMILKDLDLEVAKGSIVSIRGSSGCGKSTLARVICGLVSKALSGKFSGKVLICGDDIDVLELCEIAPKISMVFQEPQSQLFAPQVIDDIAFAPENLCLTREQIEERIKEALEMVGMIGCESESPHHLSGGQQQLVALAGILALDSEIIILDEVTSQIDADGKTRVREVVRKLKEQKKTLVIIEHGYELDHFATVRYELLDGRLSEC